MKGPRGMDHARCPFGGKVAFGTEGEARQAMRDMRKRDASHGRGDRNLSMRVYECPKCRLWHIGHDRYARGG